MTYKKGIVFYNVSQPKYKPYQKLSSPIYLAIAKKVLISGGHSLLNLEFRQEDGTEEQSFSFTLPFSKKNIEIELSKLFCEFSLLKK